MSGVEQVTGRAINRFVLSSSTANNCHAPGTPLSWCSPRSLKVIPDPATKSATVLDTQTSPGCACDLDPRRDVDGDPGDVVAASFNLTGVQADAYVHAELARAVADGEPTLNRPRRTVEGGEDAVTGCLDVPTAEAMNLALGHAVVVVEQFAPTMISRARPPASSSPRCR